MRLMMHHEDEDNRITKSFTQRSRRQFNENEPSYRLQYIRGAIGSGVTGLTVQRPYSTKNWSKFYKNQDRTLLLNTPLTVDEHPQGKIERTIDGHNFSPFHSLLILLHVIFVLYFFSYIRIKSENHKGASGLI